MIGKTITKVTATTLTLDDGTVLEYKAPENKIEFKRITNDVNGNPRYVCHFLNFIRGEEAGNVMNKYERAIKLANQIGGRKFHNKQYGGGLVFQSYNLQSTVDEINRVAGTNYTGYEVV